MIRSNRQRASVVIVERGGRSELRMIGCGKVGRSRTSIAVHWFALSRSEERGLPRRLVTANFRKQ
jgi:hypothetical protein